MAKVRSRTGMPEPVDLTVFTEKVADAMNAFSNDVTYAVLIARAAVTITSKRPTVRRSTPSTA